MRRAADWLTGRVLISRIGLTPLKGARHRDLRRVRLERDGPVGDRALCLVDDAEARVLRTVENPRMLLVDAQWDGTTLTTRTPDGCGVSARPAATGEELVADYWGREATLRLLDSPHAAQLGAHLGRRVRLALVDPGAVVYGAPVSIVTTGALARLGETEDARFRATLTLRADQDPAPGTVLRLGDATLRVRARIPRCRVIDINPATGVMDTRHLASLVDQPRPTGELPFGVDAEVLVAGDVAVGQPVSVMPS
ncbi:MOSC domain-containing protein [Janibacter terrae]|uniref:MOSC domain-containing protein n=1 Tax=Janibacter terrae TaxID=103817 RepID=UPI0009EE2E58|nr:MOSC N-terminal beta barrel domain-containing protein [Janibacter terrae]